MHIPPITSVHHPVHHPVPGAFGLQENNYVTQYQIPESFGMHGNNKSSANFGGNGYNATAGPAPSSMRFQSGVGNGLNPYNPAHATPRDTHYNSW
jgi:hypothetical protein